MSDKSEKVKQVTNYIPQFSYTLIQCAMFFLHFGLGYKMPIWVVWFPTIVFTVVLIIILLIFLIIIIVGVITDY